MWESIPVSKTDILLIELCQHSSMTMLKSDVATVMSGATYQHVTQWPSLFIYGAPYSSFTNNNTFVWIIW